MPWHRKLRQMLLREWPQKLKGPQESWSPGELLQKWSESFGIEQLQPPLTSVDPTRVTQDELKHVDAKRNSSMTALSKVIAEHKAWINDVGCA